MKKTLVKLFSVAVLTIAFIPTAFAGGGGFAPMDISYSNISFNVSVKASAKASYVAITGDYALDRQTDRQGGIQKLKETFLNAKQQLKPYGKVTRNSQNIYAYTDYAYTEPTSEESVPTTYYNGNLGIRVDLNNTADIERVQEIMLDLGFNAWVDAQLAEEDKINLELEVADQLKALIDKKKNVYKKILGMDLKKSTSLYINSWMDGYFLDIETGMAPVTVSADVTFTIE